MRRLATLILAIGVPAILAETQLVAQNKIPDEARAILDKAGEFELISLDPVRPREKPKDAFHGWKVLGKTTVKDAETRRSLIAAFAKGVEENKGIVAACFNPRHGIRASHDGKTVDFVICFECFSVQAFMGDKSDKGFLITRSPEALFNKVLREAKVALPEKDAQDKPPAKKELFAAEAWYKEQKAQEQAFVGYLQRTERGKGVVGIGRFNPYYLTEDKEGKKPIREVYVGGKMELLAPYVGLKIVLIGKPVDMNVEGREHREIWPARLQVPDQKDPDLRPNVPPGVDPPKQGKQAQIQPAPDLTAAIKDVLTSKTKLEDVRLHVSWDGKSATVYGKGVGIWNREKQFSLPTEKVLQLVKTLDDAKFGSMKAGFGGLKFGGVGPRPGAPEVLIGSVSLTIAGKTQGSNQLGGGEQSKELADLARSLLAVCETAAKNGVGAASLPDALQKVAKNELMPEVLSLLVQRIEKEGIGPNGWILRLHGQVAEVQVRSAKGISDPYRVELTEKELADICKLLIDNGVAGLPINLYAPDYTDFSVEILKHKKSLQARKFARMTPQTHGERQKDFDRIFTALEQLQARVVKEGKTALVPDPRRSAPIGATGTMAGYGRPFRPVRFYDLDFGQGLDPYRGIVVEAYLADAIPEHLLVQALVQADVQPVKFVKQWKGKFVQRTDEPLMSEAPKSGYLANEKAWAKLWKAWRGKEELPKVDFEKQLVLVGVAGLCRQSH